MCVCTHAVYGAALSQSVVDAGAAPLLVLCLLEPEMALKRIAASTLSDISKHTPELAQTVVDTGAIAHLAHMILSRDAKLKVGLLRTSRCFTMKESQKHQFHCFLTVRQSSMFKYFLSF